MQIVLLLSQRAVNDCIAYISMAWEVHSLSAVSVYLSYNVCVGVSEDEKEKIPIVITNAQ